MKKLDFEVLCGELLISPAIALESQSVRDALADRDDKRVRLLLETEF